jgi:hypothetical protein
VARFFVDPSPSQHMIGDHMAAVSTFFVSTEFNDFLLRTDRGGRKQDNAQRSVSTIAAERRSLGGSRPVIGTPEGHSRAEHM